MDIREEEQETEGEKLLTKITHQKALSVNRIEKAWKRQIDDILDEKYRLTENIGRDTLRALASLAESEPLSRVKPVLVSCIHHRAAQEPHDGHSRAERLTRVDVLETKAIIHQANQMPKADKTTRNKRALSKTPAEPESPGSPSAKRRRPQQAPRRNRAAASKVLDALRTSHGDLDFSPETGRNHRPARLSSRLSEGERSDIEDNLPDLSRVDDLCSYTKTANDIDLQDEVCSTISEQDNNTRHVSPFYSNPWRDNIDRSIAGDSHNRDQPPACNNMDSAPRSSCPSSPAHNPLSTTDSGYHSSAGSSGQCSETTQKIQESISSFNPLEVNRQLTHLMHERCQQFKMDMDFLRETLSTNLTRAQQELDMAHQSVNFLGLRLQEAECRRETATQSYQSAQSRYRQAQIAYTQHEALKDFGKDAKFRGDIHTLAAQLRSKWREIEEELQMASEPLEGAEAAAKQTVKACQEIEVALVPARRQEEKATAARDACKDTLERVDHGPPGLAEMMVKTFAGILPQSLFNTERDAAADTNNEVTGVQ